MASPPTLLPQDRRRRLRRHLRPRRRHRSRHQTRQIPRPDRALERLPAAHHHLPRLPSTPRLGRSPSPRGVILRPSNRTVLLGQEFGAPRRSNGRGQPPHGGAPHRENHASPLDHARAFDQQVLRPATQRTGACGRRQQGLSRPGVPGVDERQDRSNVFLAAKFQASPQSHGGPRARHRGAGEGGAKTDARMWSLCWEPRGGGGWRRNLTTTTSPATLGRRAVLSRTSSVLLRGCLCSASTRFGRFRWMRRAWQWLWRRGD